MRDPKKNFGMTDEEWGRWLAKFGDEPEPSGCIGCGAIAGCCDKYPHCPGNPDWKPEPSTVNGDHGRAGGRQVRAAHYEDRRLRRKMLRL